ncbi:uncharacterized protein TRAVEDRAFT_51609 [Trametes versicolor FP-101664 SS1]|uniref:uncharacterized protein n=1 Tax=Trametes versicolor (strain FP-101664) TaxID=717944 RepID=UPI0004623899|nr:uncharacterized protein TRAVEDRAFT_51609 [Trametes versicolor FP-101664 SS1]EIW53865.1 hypothetical protein TRAVEDRAFT_51609 [Trametes versicolor FP-101664 SS1]
MSAREKESSSLQATDGTRSAFLDLPDEILLQIFRDIPLVRYECDPSVLHVGHSPWLEALRTMKALTLVSKAALGPARTVLYEDIVLRRMGQIPALARTLQASREHALPGDVAHLVRSIRIDQCPILVSCKQAIYDSLGVILERCSQLRSFTYHPHRQFPFVDYVAGKPDAFAADGFFNPIWLVTRSGPLLRPLSTTLRTLDLSIPFSEKTLIAIHGLLGSASALASLKLSATSFVRRFDVLGPINMPVIRLPTLTSLEIEGNHPRLPEYIASRWEMPQLRELTLLRCSAYPTTLFHTLGAHLTFIHIYFLHLWTGNPDAIPSFSKEQIENLPRLCPALVHLIIPDPQCGPLTLRSSTLQFLDVWVASVDTSALSSPELACVAARDRLLSPASDVPALSRARLLLTTFVPWHSQSMLRSKGRQPDWPRICHPTLIPRDSHEVLFFRFPGTWVAQFAWGFGYAEHPQMVLPNPTALGDSPRAGTPDSTLEDAESSSDEYVVNSSSEDSDSDSDQGGVDDLENLDLDPPNYQQYPAVLRFHDLNNIDAEPQLDSPAILDMFARSHDTQYHADALWDPDD